MISFAIRNIKIFFRDKSAVFFSLLSVFIIIALYALFLGDVWIQNMRDLPSPKYLMSSWIMSGLLAVTAVTTTMGTFGIMIYDKSSHVYKDLASSPIKRVSLTGGYIVSSFFVGIIMFLITLVLSEGCILYSGGELLTIEAALKVIGVLLAVNLCSIAMILLIVSFFSSPNAFGTASSLIGTLIGFLTGIYLPVGQLPGSVQTIIKLFPVSHGAALLRQLMMEQPMAVNFANVSPEYINAFEREMGITISFGETAIPPVLTIVILLLSAIAFFGLAVIKMSQKEK